MLDERDAALIALLREDGRTPWAKLGSTVGLSSDAVRVRVERLIAEGSARLTTLIDPSVFGYTSTVSVTIQVLGDPGGFLSWAREQDAVIHLVRVLGRASYFAEVVAASPQEAHALIFEGIGSAPGVREVEAIPVLRVLRWRDDTRPNWMTRSTAAGLEDGDVELMRQLIDEPRLELTELADRVGRPYGAVRRRVLALYSSGIVRTTAVVDDAAMGGKASAVLLVPRTQDPAGASERLLAQPEVTILTATSGRFGLVGEVVTRSAEQMAEALDRISAAAGSSVEALPYARVEKLPGSLSFRHERFRHERVPR